MITDCCSAEIVEDSTMCSDCGEHAIELEDDDNDCCVSATNGFPCTCIKTIYAYSQQAEDDGQGDYERDMHRDFLDDC